MKTQIKHEQKTVVDSYRDLKGLCRGTVTFLLRTRSGIFWQAVGARILGSGKFGFWSMVGLTIVGMIIDASRVWCPSIYENYHLGGLSFFFLGWCITAAS